MHAFLAALLFVACGAAASDGSRATGAALPRDGGPSQDASADRRAAPLARLELLDRGDGPEAWAVNLLAGPVEVVLRARDTAPASRPALPARATVPARGRVLVARLARADAELRLEVIPGHPGATPRDVEYGWPLATRTLAVSQGWGGAFSHQDDENRHAVDFAVPQGTPVLAAREGTVMQVESGFAAASTASPRDVERANFIRILHDDGTMAVYAHLAHGGVDVRPGERVRRGQRIGTSGSSGYSIGPHLHFAVQANRGLRLVSLPFRMFGPGGVLRFSDATPPPVPRPAP